MTANVYLENAVGKPGFAWTTGVNCMISGDSDKSDAKIAVKRKSENVPGGKDFEYSKSYRQEKLSCNASLSDGHGSSCEANVTLEGSYTVVKVDVQIEGTTELQEEERGAYTYYVPDGDSPLWQEEWTNSLKKVTITCEPSDGVMAAQTVDIKFTEHQLWVKAEDGTYEEAKNSYTVNELNKTTFYLHGHEKSEKYKGEKIVATHNNSGATDQAFYTVFGRPWLVPDYDRKNGIDPKDIATAKEGKKIFRFWINNDDDTRSEDGILFFDGLGHIHDMTLNKPEGGPNQKSDKVSGYCDLEDFTPILLDISEVFPDGTPFELEKKVKWTMNSSCAGVVWTKLDASSAGDFLTAAYSNFGEDLDEHSYKADILRLADAKRPVEIPAKPLRHIVENGNKGVFLLEGLAEGDDIEIGVDIDNGKGSERITHGKLLVKIDYVEAMYRWMDLRAHLGKEPASPVHSNGLGEPLNGPDDNCNGFSRGSRHWVFAHGFNVNVDEARGWASTVFKRLWQSGDNSRYTFANWAGDEGQFSMPVEGLVSLDYYKDSENAFKTAGEFARQCGKLSGDIHLMAHSLGNILVSEAIQQYDLPYSRYYMLNAAVALQAYDPSAHIDDLMKDKAWDGLSKKEYTASYWHTLFPGEDFRSTLHWTNRYWKVHDNYNVYSATDHRLKNLEINERGHLLKYSVWVLQEKAKGTVLVDCINVIDTLNWKVDAVDLAREGGWGMNVSAYPDCFVRMGVGYGVLSKAGALPRDAVVTNPLFLPFKNRPKACGWWNGYSAFLDFSHPNANAWFTETLDGLVRDYEVDGFKLDGADLGAYDLSDRRASNPNATSGSLNNSFCSYALKYPFCEVRNVWRMQQLPVVVRLHDKPHKWEALHRIVADMIGAGLIGQPFICPDMVGGGEWTTFIPGSPFDPELFIRSAQIHALCPMMQISASPWRVLDKRHQAIFSGVVALRQKFAPKFAALAKKAGEDGEPILRSLEYNFPGHGYAAVIDEFMMGTDLLVAPVMEKGATSRKVILPPGDWTADDGKVYTGGTTISVDAPLSRLPHFVRRTVGMPN